MDWTEIIDDLETKVSSSEERTQRLRRMLQDAKAELRLESPGRRGSNGLSPQTPATTTPRAARRHRRRSTPVGPTIKDLMVQVLREADGKGLTPIEMRHAIMAKGRDVNRKSISAQLTHMKADGDVVHLPTGKWRLAENENPDRPT